MISSFSPGKLYIAGEYAVIEKAHSAIVIAIDQFITVSLKESKHMGSIQAFDNSPITFNREGNKIVLDYRDNNLSYVINSIKVVESLAQELNKELKYYDLIVHSDLQNEEGKKYGLGSSGAVTVSTVKVLLDFYQIKLTDLEIFKLAALVHFKINSNGSCGDLAASVFGGFIHYQNFDQEYVKDKMKTKSIQELLAMEWPYLKIEHLNVPKDLDVLIGWTKTPSSTTVLVDELNHNREDNTDYHKEFLAESSKIVNNMITGFNTNDTKLIQDMIKLNRDLLKKLANNLNLLIETETLTSLCDIANKHAAAAKTSGAGGGDCGIVILDKLINQDNIIEEWKDNEIQHLPLNVYYKEQV